MTTTPPLLLAIAIAGAFLPGRPVDLPPTTAAAGVQLASDGVGVFTACWVDSASGLPAIYCTLSTGGAVWQRCIIATDPAEFVVGPLALGRHPSGRLVLGYGVLAAPGELVVSRISDDSGATWASPVQVSDQPWGDARSVHLAVSDRGTILAVWEDSRAGSLSIYGSRSGDGVNWSSGVSVSPPTPCVSPRIASGLGDDACVLAQCSGAVANEEVIAFCSNDDGMNWRLGVRVDLAPSGAAATTPDITRLCGGEFLAGWTDYRPATLRNQVFTSVSSDGGRTWSVEALASDAGSGDAFSPRIAAGQGQNVTMVWTDTRSGPSEVRAGQSAGGFIWQPSEAVSDSPAEASSGVAVISSDGRGVAAWMDTRDGGVRVYGSETVAYDGSRQMLYLVKASGQVRLEWSGASCPTRIARRNSPSGGWLVIQSVAVGVGWSDTTLGDGLSYWYRVE